MSFSVASKVWSSLVYRHTLSQRRTTRSIASGPRSNFSGFLLLGVSSLSRRSTSSPSSFAPLPDANLDGLWNWRSQPPHHTPLQLNLGEDGTGHANPSVQLLSARTLACPVPILPWSVR